MQNLLGVGMSAIMQAVSQLIEEIAGFEKSENTSFEKTNGIFFRYL